MLASTRRCYVFGGKGGVGKTSMAASLAVKFANHGEPTAIVSTEPSPSLGDLFEQVPESLCQLVEKNLFSIFVECLACAVYRTWVLAAKLYASLDLTLFLQLR
jgi:MinD superfamily P-loop ATPase